MADPREFLLRSQAADSRASERTNACTRLRETYLSCRGPDVSRFFDVARLRSRRRERERGGRGARKRESPCDAPRRRATRPRHEKFRLPAQPTPLPSFRGGRKLNELPLHSQQTDRLPEGSTLPFAVKGRYTPAHHRRRVSIEKFGSGRPAETEFTSCITSPAR